MKRTVLSAVLTGALCLSLGLAGCGKTQPLSNGDNVNTPSGNDVAAQSVTLNIASYNIKNCDKGGAIDKIAADINSKNLDVVAVQEVDRNTKRADGKDVLRELAEKTLQNFHFYKVLSLPGGDYGIGILSKYPLENCKQTKLKTAKGAEERILAQAEITVRGIKLHVFNTHLSFEDKESRLEQIKYINGQLPEKEPFLLMGDFNVQGYEEYDGFTRGNALNNTKTGFMTYIEEDEAFRALDNILYSKNIKLEKAEMVKTSASDHNMLMGTFTIQK